MLPEIGPVTHTVMLSPSWIWLPWASKIKSGPMWLKVSCSSTGMPSSRGLFK